MIVRIWHGRTARGRADEYAAFLHERGIPDTRDIEGNVEVMILRRDEHDVSHFMTVTLWSSEDAIRAFTGDNVRTSKYYPEDEGYLLEFEPEVQLFELVAKAP